MELRLDKSKVMFQINLKAAFFEKIDLFFETQKMTKKRGNRILQGRKRLNS